jgi:hypothetical protein
VNPAEPGGAPRAIRLAASIAGVLLVVAAVAAVWRHRETLSASFASLRDPPPWAVAALPLATLVSLVIGAVILKRLFHRRPDLRVADLLALNAAATLFNLLPMKAGLAGRIAWQKRYQDVSVRSSLGVTAAAVLLSAGAVAIATGSLLVASAWAVPAPAILFVVAAVLLVLAPAAKVGFACELLWWRIVDLGAWTMRIAAAFAILGADLSADSALALACVTMASGLIPILGSTLGVREWVIALVAPSLAGVSWEQALAAELVARGFEIAVVAISGGAGSAWLVRRSVRR